MGLQTQSPVRMGQAISNCGIRVAPALGAVHWLQEEMAELQMPVALRLGARLRKDQFQFIAGCLHEFGSSLWADTDPVDGAGNGQCAVGFNRDIKAPPLQGFQEPNVDLKHRLASGQHYEWTFSFFPNRHTFIGEGLGSREPAATRTVRADEFGIAKLTDGLFPVRLDARPEIATGEPAENSSAAGIRPFALERAVYFFY